MGKANVDIVCKDCTSKKWQPSIRFSRLTFLYNLQVAGYPLKGDDATLQEWQDLAEFKKELSKQQ